MSYSLQFLSQCCNTPRNFTTDAIAYGETVANLLAATGAMKAIKDQHAAVYSEEDGTHGVMHSRKRRVLLVLCNPRIRWQTTRRRRSTSLKTLHVCAYGHSRPSSAEAQASETEPLKLLASLAACLLVSSALAGCLLASCLAAGSRARS